MSVPGAPGAVPGASFVLCTGDGFRCIFCAKGTVRLCEKAHFLFNGNRFFDHILVQMIDSAGCRNYFKQILLIVVAPP